VALLVLLNGPPASGKSTIAERLVDRRCGYLDTQRDVVQIDAVRDEIDATVHALEQVLADAAGGEH
jgi:adenylate kinase family enzyme